MATQYKPILFSTKMVQAILEGRKTQTRRIIKPQPKKGIIATAFDFKKGFYASKIKIEENPDRFEITELFKPKFQIGDILWVRETFINCSSFKEYPLFSEIKGNFCYKTNNFIGGHKWKPSIHMPKEAARIFLEVTNVRVERLQDISEEDAIAEGIKKTWINDDIKQCRFKNYINDGKGSKSPIDSFNSLWKKINGEDSWNANPWVWVYEFKQVHHPKGFLNEH